MSLKHFKKLLAYLKANFYPWIPIFENMDDFKLVLKSGRHLALSSHKIPLTHKEYVHS
jgi:hypothetical protein